MPSIFRSAIFLSVSSSNMSRQIWHCSTRIASCSGEGVVENKAAIVEEVLNKLRGMAESEAKLLFREWEMYGGSLPHISQVISNAINVTTDALAVALDELTQEDREALLPLFW